MELFKRELEELVNPEHALVKLGRLIDWTVFEEKLGAKYHASIGEPGVNTRLMVALHYLKYQFDLSDEVVVAQWVENIYWQHFSGEQFIRYETPTDPSSMTRWRKRLGEEGAELMLKQTIDAGMKMRVITPRQIKWVNIDTTVQTKAIRFPTDARLRGNGW
jgi:IS5 family transposase